jgi:S1/P1 Nuclease
MGSGLATSPFSFISLATSISPCIRQRTLTAAERANRSTSRRQLADRKRFIRLLRISRRGSQAKSEQIAWESHQLAETDVYQALGIPGRPCELHSCDPGTRTAITLNETYMDREAQVAGSQLAKAGHRLASLLDQIWPLRTAALPERTRFRSGDGPL